MLDWILSTLIKVLSALLCRMHPAVAVWIGKCLGELMYWLQPKRSIIGVLNVRAAFNGQMDITEARRIIRACYRHMGAGIFEMLRLPAIDKAHVRRYIKLEGFEKLDAAIATGRPVVVITGHYGNWELSSIVGALLGYPIVALARAQNKFPRLYRLLVSYRESKGCHIVHKGGAMRHLVSALDKRQLVGIVGDQASRQGIFVDFFGRPALFSTGPFDLAYEQNALIMPLFIHRVKGPFHRLVIEPAIDLSLEKEGKELALQAGITRFTEVLSSHISKDPIQWLWMHKRWKRTPTRRILVLHDGKTGHLKQSLAVTEAICSDKPYITHQVVNIRFRNPLARTFSLLWSWWMPKGFGAVECLRWALTPTCSKALLSQYADLIISCGASTVPVNLLWALENRAKSVVIMSPSPLPLKRFDLVIAPRHDRLPARSNLVVTLGALNHISEDTIREAAARLTAHPNFRNTTVTHKRARTGHQPVISVFLGGNTSDYELTPAFAESLLTQVLTACEISDASCLVTTSRRTTAAVERAVSQKLSKHKRCKLLIIANRDPIDGTMDGMLGCGDVAIVTGESISMVSEACASGRHVLVVEPMLRDANRTELTKHQRFIHELEREGFIHISLIPEVAHALGRLLKRSQPAKRLDSFGTVLEAVARLL